MLYVFRWFSTEATFVYWLNSSTSGTDEYSVNYIIGIWVFWFVTLLIVVVVVTHLSALVERAKEKRNELFHSWGIDNDIDHFKGGYGLGDNDDVGE